MLTYEEIIVVTQSIPFVIAMISIWLLPIIFYTLIAGVTHARSTNGNKLSKSILNSVNSIIPFLTWGIIQGGLFLFLYFPVWAK